MVLTIISARMALARAALMGVQRKPSRIGCGDGLGFIGWVILKWKGETDVDRHYIEPRHLPQKTLVKFLTASGLANL